MPEQQIDQVDVEAVRAQATEVAKAEFAKTSAEILALGAKHNKRDLANKAIGEGYSVEQFRGALLDVIGNDKPLEVAEPDISTR